MISTEIPISFRTKIVLCDAVPRRINASTPVEKDIETAPTKRSVSQIGNHELEFFCSSLTFLIAKITNIFRKMIHGQATA